MNARADIVKTRRCERLSMLMRYKRWADALTFKTALALPEAEAFRERPTRWNNIVHTLNHVYVVDDIFKAHLEGRKHDYTHRNTDQTPAAADLWTTVQRMDDWYVALADSLTERDLDEVVTFEFVGGGEGSMTKEDVLLHIVNHATYHRGLISDMFYQIPVMPLTNDLTVFLRDHYGAAVACDARSAA
jgi:uncharacterized damage-inducible protein DinB